MQIWIWPVISERADRTMRVLPAVRALKLLLFAALATPLALLIYDVAGEIAVPGSRLGADPATAVVRELGSWGILAMLMFLSILLLGWAYAYRERILEWK